MLPDPEVYAGLFSRVEFIEGSASEALRLQDPDKICRLAVILPGPYMASMLWTPPARNDGPLLCENCGKPLADHDAMAQCWHAEK
jgi:hypothetical protein